MVLSVIKYLVDRLEIDAKAFAAAWDYVVAKQQGDLNLMRVGGLYLWALTRFGMTVEEQLEDEKQFWELNRRSAEPRD